MGKQLGQLATNVQKQAQCKKQSPANTAGDQQLAPAKEFTADQKAVIASTLGECLVVQRTYGAKEEDFITFAEIVMSHLSDHELEDVIDAIRHWLKISPNFPTLADIRNILEPEPIFDRAVYQTLQNKKRNREHLDPTERNYLKQYEQNAMKGL